MKTVSIGFSAVEGAKAGQLQGRQGKGGGDTPAGKDFLSLLAVSNAKLNTALERAPADLPVRAAPFRVGLADPTAGNGDVAVATEPAPDDAGDTVDVPKITDEVAGPTAIATDEAETSTDIDVPDRTRGDRPHDKDICDHSGRGKVDADASAHDVPRFAGHGTKDVDDTPVSADPVDADGSEETDADAGKRVDAQDRRDRKSVHDTHEVPAAPTGPADAARASALDRPERAPRTDKSGEARGNRTAALEHAEAMATKAGAEVPPAGLQHAAPLHTQPRDQDGEAVSGEADTDAALVAMKADTGAERASMTAGMRTEKATTSAAQTSGDTAAEPAKLPDTASQVARDVTATGQFTTPSGQHQAPGHEAAGANAQSLVTAIRHNSDWSRMLGDPVARLTQRTGPGGVNMDVLKIDLHPASLGRMEASLKAHGDRMSITITVSSRDAAASIGNDIAGIQAGLRAAGYTVDQVTVEVRGQSGNPSGWAASQQDTSAGGFARGGGRQQQMEAPDNGFASLRSGRTGDETVRSPGSAYVI